MNYIYHTHTFHIYRLHGRASRNKHILQSQGDQSGILQVKWPISDSTTKSTVSSIMLLFLQTKFILLQ